MAGKLRARTALLLLMAVCQVKSWPAALGQDPAQAAQQKNIFTVREASALLKQINDGMVARRAGKVLGSFDLNKMSGGALFRQQITSFLSHTDSIRMHFNVTDTRMEGEKGTATVDAELEADSPDGNTPPLHKRAPLRFVAEQTGAGWKFTDVQPRSFFSTSNSGPAASGGATPPR